MNRKLLIKIFLLFFFFIGILTVTKIPSIASYFIWNTSVFVKNDFNFNKIRAFNTQLDYEEISSLLPHGAVVYFKDAHFPKSRYTLYPIKVKSYDDSFNENIPKTYLIDYSETIYQNAHYILLKTGQKLIDVSNSGFLNEKLHSQDTGIIKTLVVFIVMTLSYIFMGLIFLKLLKFAPYTLLHLFTSSYIAGLLLHSIVLSIELLSGLLLSQTLIIINIISILLILLIILKFKIKDLFSCLNKNDEIKKIKQYFNFTLIVVILLVIIISVSNFIRPVDAYDAISFWMFKAKILFHEKSFYFGDVHKNEYPILLPLYVATHYVLLNGISDILANWTVSLLYVCLLSQIYVFMLFLLKNKLISIIAVLLYILFFYFPNVTNAPTGDQFLMVFYLITVFHVFQYILYNENRNLYVSFFFAIGLTLSKQEGYIYTFIIGFSILFFTFSHFKKLKPYIIFLAFCSLYLLFWGWRYYMCQQGFYLKSEDFTGEPLTIYKVFVFLKTQFFDIHNADIQNGFILGVLFSLMVLKKDLLDKKETQYIVFVILISLSFVLFSILPWSIDSIINHSLTATPRLLIQSSPLFVILICFLSRDYIYKFLNISSKE